MTRKTKDQSELNEEENKEIKSKKSIKKEKVAKETSTKSKKSISKSTTKSSTKSSKSKVKSKTQSKTPKASASAKKKTLATSLKTTPDVEKHEKDEDIIAPIAIQPTADPSKFKIIEYYDLPYRYNQTVVKVLAQTPTTLFIYWDISDKDRKSLKEKYGDDFFETTKPILIVYNETLGYNFEVEINDFANSWYLHVNDAKCKYRVELGRRPIPGLMSHQSLVSSNNTNNANSSDNFEKIDREEIPNYIYISVSNEMESPNNHILFNPNQKVIHFKNVKTGAETVKEISSIPFIKRNIHEIYNLYDLYQVIYQDENVEEIYDLSNPSSGGNPSSSTSSYFKLF